jgi:hypothetical protein
MFSKLAIVRTELVQSMESLMNYYRTGRHENDGYESKKFIARLGKTRGILASAFVVLILASAGMSVFAFAPTFGAASNLSNTTENATYPNVQVSGNNVYVVWQQKGKGIDFKMSPNGGSTWDPTIRLSTTGGAGFPLMEAWGSNVYVVWSQSDGINFVASSNNGSTFSAPYEVSAGINQSITPVLAAYGTHVYVGFDGNGSSYVASSENNGATWSAPFHYGSGPEPQLAAWGNNVYATSDSFTRSTTSVSVSTNGGQTWKKAATDGGGAEPWIMAYGNNVVVAWETKGNASQVFITSSSNSGSTFSKPFAVNTPQAWAPMIGVFGNTEYVAYRTNPGSVNSQEYVVVSTNGGASWSSPIAIGNAGEDNSWPTQVAVNSSSAFILWYVHTKAASSAPWEAVAVEGQNNGSSWSAPIVLGGSLAESDVATAAIASFGSTAFAVWTNTTSSGIDQIYFSSGS